MAFCSNCGSPMGAGARFCEKCGAAVPGQPVAPPPVAAPPIAASPVPVSPAPAAAAPAPAPVPSQGSNTALKVILGIVGVFALLVVLVMGSCFYIGYRVKQPGPLRISLRQGGGQRPRTARFLLRPNRHQYLPI